MTDVATMDKIVSLCKRRGLIFPASEIYGGIANTYDYGHYGVLLKNNVVAQWWKAMIQERDDIVALDSAIIQHPRTWEASGHLAGFTDPLVDCRTCKLRFRADHLEEVRAGTAQHDEVRCGRAPSKLPGEHAECDLTDARAFNLMFETSIGPVQDAGSRVFLRPETAQGIFLDYKTTLQYSRKRPPFGIAQVGKSFRNEITPGNFVFRTLEFEQMEMEFFVPPAEAQQWYEHWLEQRMEWYVSLGIEREKLRLRAHDADMRQHQEHSGEKLEYIDPQTKERYLPHVIEPAAGLGRTILALLCDAYDEDEQGGEQRTVLRLHPKVAPIKVAVLPLLRKDGHPELAREVYEDLRGRMSAEYDAGGHIGKRYRRQDEIGTPFAVTIDHQSVEDHTVTLRQRDSLQQDRIAIADLAGELEERIR